MKQWYQKQLRVLQTVLREKDIIDYDAHEVVSYMIKVGANCLVVNAGGVIDFFPNETELGRPNRFMKDQNILADLIEAAHTNGIHVIGRVDFRGVEKERYERRPHWFGQDENGNPLMGWENTIHRPCYTSHYGREHAQEFVKQLLTRYDLDGIWENCVIFGYGPCYCSTCTQKYREATGKEIPREKDYFSEEFRDYREWKSIYAKAHIAEMQNTVKQFGNDKAYVSEIFGMFHASTAVNSGIDLYDAKDTFDFLVSPTFLDGSAQDDKKYDCFDHSASAIRFLASISPDKQSVALTGGNGTKWRYVIAPVQESRIWMWQVLGSGGNLWNNYFNGMYPGEAVDRRNAGIEQDFFGYMKANEEWISDQIPAGNVGIFYSRETRDTFCSNHETEDDYGVYIKGVERVLNENHIQYRYLPNLDFSFEKIQDLSILLLPNAACMSNNEMEIIRRFVENGGGVVASYKTSLYDEQGHKRDDFGLKDLFGCSYTGIQKKTASDCYQKIRVQHPVLDGMRTEYTEMILNEGETLLCTVENKNYTTVCTYVPPIYNQPPEYAWIPNEETDYPTILVGQAGKGRIVYFANQIEKTCYTNGHEDLLNTYTNAIRWVRREPFLLETNAPDSVRLSLTVHKEHPNRKVLSLVNLTSGAYRPARSILPVYDITVKLLGKIQNYKILRQEGAIEARGISDCANGADFAEIRFSQLNEFSSIFIEMAE